MKNLLLFCMAIFSVHVMAQEKKDIDFMVTMFNNATALPFTGKAGVWYIPFHPGFTLGIGRQWNNSEDNVIFQTLRIGYYYHRFAQHGLQAYTETGYRRTFLRNFDGEAKLGIGYLHAIPDSRIFRLNDQGVYVKQPNRGRPQAMAGFSIGVGYDFLLYNAPLRLFLDHQFWMQMPFVGKYVPLLPNVSMHLGLSYKFSRK